MSAAVIRLVPKMRAIEATLEACRNGDCQPQDVAVVAYICSSIDRATGDCTRHYATIGEKCGMSRSAAGRSIKRLVDAGIIERAPQQARNGGQISTAFTIAPRPTSGTPPSHQRDAHKDSSRSLQFPDGGPSENDRVEGKPERPPAAARLSKREFTHDLPADWGDVEEWLWQQVGYGKLYSDASRSDAAIELRHLRQNIGDQALASAIARAKTLRLYGRPLLDFLENTRPSRRGAA